jgi:hypothetical protein
VLKGNARTVLQYCEENHRRNLLDPSFYELLGRLVTLRFYGVANLILSYVEGLGVLGMPNEREGYEFWYGKLKPLCDKARRFINAPAKVGPRRNQSSSGVPAC